jgi:GntR family transcriptional regulator
VALPPERDLAEMYEISRITVRKAIDGLVEQGLLVRRQGSGNFVSSRVEKNFAKLTSFSEDMRARGRTPRSVWLKRAAGTVTPEEALTMGLSPGTLDAVDTSLYAALEASGHRPTRALQRLRAILLSSEQAQLLNAAVGAAGLLVERLGSLPDGRAVEFSQSFYRGDTYDFVAELSAAT